MKQYIEFHEHVPLHDWGASGIAILMELLLLQIVPCWFSLPSMSSIHQSGFQGKGYCCFYLIVRFSAWSNDDDFGTWDALGLGATLGFPNGVFEWWWRGVFMELVIRAEAIIEMIVGETGYCLCWLILLGDNASSEWTHFFFFYSQIMHITINWSTSIICLLIFYAPDPLYF